MIKGFLNEGQRPPEMVRFYTTDNINNLGKKPK